MMLDAFATYTVTTSAWLAIQAIPQILTPSIIIQLLIVDPTLAAKPDDLQIYLARSTAIAQLSLATLSLLLSGLIPLTRDNTDTFATPTTIVTTGYHFFTAFYAYSFYTANGQTAYALGMAGSGALAAMGTWAILFGGGGHVSRRTGKDKRMSGFPFGDRKGRAEELKSN